MIQTLDYARPAPRRPSRTLAFAAHLASSYPLLLLGSLYGEWLLASLMLGHQPRPSLDDPKGISGSSWMHPIPFVALMGMLPAACATLILNALYVINSRIRGRRLLTRLAGLLSLWLGMLATLRLDPLKVLFWWLD